MRFKLPSIIVAAVLAFIISRDALAQCSTLLPVRTFNIDRSVDVGWSLSFGLNPCEGLVLLQAQFSARGYEAHTVMNRATIAQIHVPYSPGNPRHRDVGVSTTGLGVNAVVLSPAECPGGDLYEANKICVTVKDRGLVWKYGSNSTRGQALSLFVSSQLGEFNYLNLWSFLDDGTIEVRTGLTGRLQVRADGEEWLGYGSRINDEADPTPQVALNHQQNIYYRLDFDIGTAANNAVNNISLQPTLIPSPSTNCGVLGQCFVIQETPLTNETVDYQDPFAFTSWRIYNKVIRNDFGRLRGYELIPTTRGKGYGMYDTDEPWSSGELWVTRYNQCHLLATDNHPPLIRDTCAGTADNLTEMVAGGGSIDGTDIVVWYANRFSFQTRDEDQPNLPIQWTGFDIKPRSFHHVDPMFEWIPGRFEIKDGQFSGAHRHGSTR